MMRRPVRGRKRLRCACVLVLCFAGLLPAQQDPSRQQSRSMVMTQYGIVATSQAVASQAGAAILARGGSAVDAAIAANAALGVIEPMMNGVGGDLFAIVYDAKTKKLYGLNASGWAPKGMSVESLKAKGVVKDIPETGMDSVTVPGAVAGWDALRRRFGKLAMADDVAPAAALAEKGVAVPETDAENWLSFGVPFVASPGFARIFLPDGKAPVAGEIFRNPELAATLRRIGEHFYRGATAEAMLKLSREQHGFLEADDLADFQPEWVEPVSTTYHGWTVWEMPPNGQGIAALSMLNIMERFPIAAWGHNSQKSLHVEIEAQKLAYADLQHYIGDPHASHIPVEQLISKQLAAKRAAQITDRAQCNVLPSELTQQMARLASDTTYLAVADHEGNEVSLIQSNSGAFGSGLVAAGTGFVLQNRAGGFTLKPGQPNTLRPRTRPLHTIIPGFMQKGDQRIAFGIMGGFNQAQAHAQFVSNVADFQMNIQAAVEAARFRKTGFSGCKVLMENGVAPAVMDELRKQGHEITVELRYSQSMGRGNAVEHHDSTGVNYGSTDPRADGEAVPEEVPLQP
ncbi:MAG: gamma-glutamyltranspeptidase / glutathione hydrolase [Acidobacteriaceae bacterium]|nr:gamma-glutamyltranspeptidase / glutathione hydrolase [Acidobacteriaceae bacterium]